MSAPVFILAPHRSYTSVTCAMLGQHPQLFGVPELNLFIADRMAVWWQAYSAARGVGASGLVRTVAEVCFREQTEEAAECARGWIRRRLDRTTMSVFLELAAAVHPLAIVDKSPLNARPRALERLNRTFPNARYLHLIREPTVRARSVLAALPQFDLPPDLVDPIERWYSVHAGILDFLERVPSHRWIRIRGEDVLSDPSRQLQQVASWLRIRTDREAIEEMLHPERSPFATFGPPSAPLGNDVEFLRRPELRGRPTPTPAPKASDNGASPGRLPREVRKLAAEFGYG